VALEDKLFVLQGAPDEFDLQLVGYRLLSVGERFHLDKKVFDDFWLYTFEHVFSTILAE
jgi:hypothetical protein